MKHDLAMNPIQELLQAGQSLWLDYIDRRLIESGELKGLIAAGIRGVTSNPSIFRKAIGETGAYDGAIGEMLAGDPGLDTHALCERLMIEDVQEAADVLRPVYQDADAGDGFVSLEVRPALAHDAAATIEQARRLWRAVDRPNLMIKVPATRAGLVAIERLVADGINVNVTLLFSVARYGEVADAFLRGLARNAEPDGVASVASFFVSRIDTLVDKRLEAIGTEAALALRGRAAIACAKLAYEAQRRMLANPAWAAQLRRGARPQRLLWASTSTKDPRYRDVVYVEELIGPGTVNTVPPETLAALREHGRVRLSLEDEVTEARSAIDGLARLGIAMDAVAAELEADGVRKFSDAYDGLIAALEKKR